MTLKPAASENTLSSLAPAPVLSHPFSFRNHSLPDGRYLINSAAQLKPFSYL